MAKKRWCQSRKKQSMLKKVVTEKKSETRWWRERSSVNGETRRNWWIQGCFKVHIQAPREKKYQRRGSSSAVEEKRWHKRGRGRVVRGNSGERAVSLEKEAMVKEKEAVAEINKLLVKRRGQRRKKQHMLKKKWWQRRMRSQRQGGSGEREEV